MTYIVTTKYIHTLNMSFHNMIHHLYLSKVKLRKYKSGLNKVYDKADLYNSKKRSYDDNSRLL